MNLRQSAVVALSHHQVEEAQSRLPNDIQPVYLGSGEIALAMDGTGMQGLNTNMTHQPDMATLDGISYTDSRDLCIYRDEALSMHASPKYPVVKNAPPLWGHLPLGWIGYEVTVDGTTYDAEAMLEHARDWQRIWIPRQGIVTTSFHLGLIKLTWECTIGHNGVAVDYRLVAASTDGNPHALAIRVFADLTMRNGNPIIKSGLTPIEGDAYCGALWQATDKSSTAKLKHPIDVNWVWVCDQDAAPWRDRDTRFGLDLVTTGTQLEAGFRLITGSDRDNTHTEQTLMAMIGDYRQSGSQSAFAAASHSWQKAFAGAAEYQIGDPEKEIVADTALYCLLAGSPWHSGVPLGTLWLQKFSSGTFWDSFYAADGLLRNGLYGPVRQFCKWMIKTAMPEGRPHMWVTWYDGDPATQTHEDKAYINCLAYACIAIRLYEMTKDEADLRDCVYPYLETIGTYLVNELFVQTPEGQWQMQGEVGGDIGIETVDASTQGDSLLWSVVCLDKLAEYATLLGKQSKASQKAAKISQYFRENRIKLNEWDCWYTWFPYICPADGILADYSDWWRPQDEYLVQKFSIGPAQTFEPAIIGENRDTEYNPFIGTYTGMPWGNCCVGASFLEVGEPGLALEYVDGAMKYLSGMGYLTESVFETRIGGNVPYIPSNGAYLAALSRFFVSGSLWSDDIKVGLDLPTRWEMQFLNWRNVCTLNGARVSGEYGPSQATYTIETVRPRKATLRIPMRIEGEPLTVMVNGKQGKKIKQQEKQITIQIPAGTTTVSIAADLATQHDVLIMESFPNGKDWQKMLKKSGRKVRWMRDCSHITKLEDQPRLIIMHQSYAGPPEIANQELIKRAKAGASILLIEHPVFLPFNATLAEASGVRANYDEIWRFDGRDFDVNMTSAGKRLLKTAPAKFPVRILHTADETNLAKDVKILATVGPEKKPILTRRSYGKGSIWWFGAGSRNLDRLHSVGWGLQFSREWYVFGRNREEFFNLDWMRDPHYKAVINAIATTARV